MLDKKKLNQLADMLSASGIDISAVVELSDYLSEEKLMKLLEKEDGVWDTELLEKLIPLLDQNSKSAIFERILDGSMDYHFIKVLLPYAEYLTEQIEAAVVYGVLDAEVLKIVNRYYEEKENRK